MAEGQSPQKEQGLGTTTSCNTLPWTVGEGLRQCFGLRIDSWGTCVWSVVGEEEREITALTLSRKSLVSSLQAQRKAMLERGLHPGSNYGIRAEWEVTS